MKIVNKEFDITPEEIKNGYNASYKNCNIRKTLEQITDMVTLNIVSLIEWAYNQIACLLFLMNDDLKYGDHSHVKWTKHMVALLHRYITYLEECRYNGTIPMSFQDYVESMAREQKIADAVVKYETLSYGSMIEGLKTTRSEFYLKYNDLVEGAIQDDFITQVNKNIEAANADPQLQIGGSEISQYYPKEHLAKTSSEYEKMMADTKAALIGDKTANRVQVM